jgi:hypothetical protein
MSATFRSRCSASEDKSADLLFRGEMFINQGRHLEALPVSRAGDCDLNPRDEITRCKLAALYLELNRKDDAYREYLQAAESYADARRAGQDAVDLQHPHHAAARRREGAQGAERSCSRAWAAPMRRPSS